MNEETKNAVGLGPSEVDLGGLRFIPAVAKSERGLNNHWSSSWTKPEFTTRAGLETAIGNLDEVVALTLAEVDEEKGEAFYWPEFRGIKSVKTGKRYAVRSKDYVPVQDADIARPFLDAATELGIETYGTIRGVGTGRTTGYVGLQGVDLVDVGEIIEGKSGHGYQDILSPGAHWWNSYTGETSFGADIFLGRKACANLVMVGDLLGRLKMPHKGDITREGLAQGFKNLIKDLARKIPGFIKAVEKAKATPVLEVELPDLLWSLSDLSASQINEMSAAPEKFTPEIVGGRLNVWNAYNVVEAYVSWKPGGASNPRATDKLAESAAAFLTKDVAKLIEKGKERREAYVEELKARDAARIEKETKAAEQVRVGTTAGGVR